ncbi:carboxypeptidase-like regulatory domain-containing protein [Flavobacterium sp. Fl-318]|uniref:Carboxypeptidase-like regulatory domain-containing protein n=1 Tax=Flavobacterium cupriresistens TaxID=2893885 RepID=A0ABU4R7Z8_9FLAO|nr:MULTISPECIES: TonB-dependent receptor [unclassified Flavobacterium]MDX6188721.1 carboxypeptidase-like regulatory domain-containing protein [Flavobacterium sp. Fl-318]UFH44492.1 TonB-dependent receptor [Flavobacterium sp. F-323]
MKRIFLIIFGLFGFISEAQTGAVKGKIIDKQSEKPLVGVLVTLVGNESIEAVTDNNGNFRLLNIPIGRQNLTISFTGYENTSVSDLDVTTGKDNLLTISMIEKFNALDEIVVTSGSSKAKAINKMALVSTKQFTTEEVNRYAGGRSDVARLVSNFAGVSTGDDSRNDIVVRGNSPSGMLWRIEGMPVPSPNHFSTLGTTGGPISALNPNLLANSDFLTSAFPAEYGNAISGVFDLSFRKGNPDDYEYMISAGAYPGVEFMAEGPLGKKGGSFVAAARYGFVGVLGLAGTDAQPNYRDISFNVDLGKSKIGNFSVFGIYGTSDIKFLGSKIDKEDPFAAQDEDAFVKSGFASIGLKHNLEIGTRSYLKTIIGASNAENSYRNDRYYGFQTPNETKLSFTDIKNSENRITFSTLFNSKINKKTTFRAGLLFEHYTLDAKMASRDRQQDSDGDGYPDFVQVVDNNGSYNIMQPFAQGQFRLTEKLTFNAGVHGQYFSINKEFVLEPRTALSYAVNPKNTISFGFGIHHQSVPVPVLFLNEFVDGNPLQTNKNLDLVESKHYVLGYDVRLAKKWRGKVEVYYQDINKAAVQSFPSSYSSLTEGADFGYSIDKTSLISKGKGYNQGIEFTVEKFFSEGYYALFTTSFFESKYKGSDGIERNSPFNNGYVVNLLGGKEFRIGREKKNVFSIDTKFTTAGGRYYTPVDLAASNDAGYEIRDDANAFSKQYDPYLRLDIKFGIKFNSKKKKRFHQFYIDFQNVTNHTNIFTKEYNRLTNSINQKDQIGFSPDFGYKFQF